MPNPRIPCCLDPKLTRSCGTLWPELRVWSSKVTGKGIQIVTLQGDEQGKAPFFAQPVGFDGRSFHIAWDYGCDTEKLLHEVCHWLVAPKERRNLVNYGHGPGRYDLDDAICDNEEVSVMLLEMLIAPHFRLMPDRIAKPDYNTANKRNIEWDTCEERAQTMYAGLVGGLPTLQSPMRATGSGSAKRHEAR